MSFFNKLNKAISHPGNTIKQMLKTATGVQGYQDRKEAIQIKDVAESEYNRAEEEYNREKAKLQKEITDFASIRLQSLKNEVGKFLSFLKDMNQKNKVKSYEILNEIQIPQERVTELGSLEMTASKALGTTAVAGSLGSAAAIGTATAVPGVVTSAVMGFGSASTGIAISALHGAAATNATLAWLGGGAISAGGGGMAAGAATLSAITTATTVAATGAVAILTLGTMASLHYSKKLTDAKEYEKNAAIAKANMSKAEAFMDCVSMRVSELSKVTQDLVCRSNENLELLEPLAPDFEVNDEYYVKTFQKNGLLIKAIGELAQTPLFDAQGNLSNNSLVIITKTQSILNTEL